MGRFNGSLSSLCTKIFPVEQPIANLLAASLNISPLLTIDTTHKLSWRVVVKPSARPHGVSILAGRISLMRAKPSSASIVHKRSAYVTKTGFVEYLFLKTLSKDVIAGLCNKVVDGKPLLRLYP